MLPYEMPKIQVHTPQQEITFPYARETPLEEQKLLKEKVETLENEIEKPSCTLDKNMVITFDKRVYPVTLGTTKYVLLITYLIQDPNNRKNHMTIAEELIVAVVAKDMNDGSRSVNIILGKREVKLTKLGHETIATFNGATVIDSKKRSYGYIAHREIIFVIVKLPDGSIVCDSQKYGITVAYDGNRVNIRTVDRYRNAVRGLCGNYDSNTGNDFLTPGKYLLTKPEEFAATYSSIQENSEGPVLKNRRKAE
ncbi:PREDICTED: vitellogenin-3-like [Wasmannia auropunctata]|uniref:vitellogenin-3-like n=1 Tax=Wasmannia auropunctata TaxID=64793 RepID=UPI0005EE576C|nr:PREDICTED: vitellogenin-3-like [Wasmannia auropunctata]